MRVYAGSVTNERVRMIPKDFFLMYDQRESVEVYGTVCSSRNTRLDNTRAEWGQAMWR